MKYAMLYSKKSDVYSMYTRRVSVVQPPYFKYFYEHEGVRIPSRALKGFRIYLDPFSFAGLLIFISIIYNIINIY